jgi:hypothetical protein
MPLGWMISVYRQSNGGSTPASFGTQQGDRLAVWQTGPVGIRWLDELVEQQKAVHLGGNGYPIRYTATAADVVPRIRDDPPGAKPVWTHDPGDIVTSDWLGKTTYFFEGAMRADEWLIVEAWDES